jgi:hypothetical protein
MIKVAFHISVQKHVTQQMVLRQLDSPIEKK